MTSLTIHRYSRRAIARWLLAGASALALGTSVQAAQNKWDIATGYPESNFHVVNLRQFAREVRQATGGALDIQVHAAGSLVKGPGIVKAIDAGKIAGGEVFGPSLANIDPVFTIDALPFFATDYASAQRLAEALRPTVREKLDSNGYVFLYSVAWPPQGIFSALVDDNYLGRSTTTILAG